MKNSILKCIIGALMLVACFFTGLYLNPLRSECGVQPVITELKVPRPVSLMIDRGDGVIKVQTNLAWYDGMTVFDALKTASEKQDVKLEYKDYGGDLGMFIVSIDGKKGSGDAWWQYWVNNKYGEIGASNAKLAAGDAVMWKLVKGQMK